MNPSELIDVYYVLRRVYGHQHWWPGETPFEVMVGAILTQNTAWTNVEKAILNLKKAKRLTLRTLHQTPRKILAELIRPSGYFNVKALRLRYFTEFLVKQYKGQLQRLRREPLHSLRAKLLAVNGIGPETADSILLYALNKKIFVIDAYTKRIFSRHGLASHKEDYARWQEIFMSALPARTALYNDYHAQIVRLAKDYCRKTPRCDSCPLKSFFVPIKKGQNSLPIVPLSKIAGE